MSKKYEALAQDIIEFVGGKTNVGNVYHCQTRLRFTLVNEEKANKEKLEQLDGVAKVILNAGVYQVVIGTHVKDVFEEIEKLVELQGNKEVAPKEKKNIATMIIDFVAGTFQPVIPALSGAGMVKAVLALLVVCNVITTTSQTYYLLNLFADGVFFFLPMLLAFSEAQKLKCSPILAVSVAAILMHPNWTALVAAGDPVKFFDIIPFTLATYTSTVIPIILIVFVQSYVEKLLTKWVPKAVEIVFVPMLTFLIMGTLALSVLGPIGSIVGGYLAEFFTFLSTNVSWAPAVLIGGFLPIMVMFGLHNGVGPLGVMQMANLGYDSIFGPGCVCSNIAQASATMVVAFRTKDKKLRQLATSGSITAYMGITEPALYGVNLPKKYPLIAAMIGGGFGGLYAGLTQTHRFATGSSGLPAVLLYIGDNTMTFFYNILIALLISAVISAVLTFVFSLKFEKNEEKQEETVPTSFDIVSPVAGIAIPLAEAKDEVFASGALGQGIVVEPSIGEVIAPFDATIVTLFPTKHAIGLVSDTGIELLIHVGVNTVELNGKHFTSLVKKGDRVSAGQRLVTFDIEAIKAEGYATETMMIITNSTQFSNIRDLAKGSITSNSPLLAIESMVN